MQFTQETIEQHAATNPQSYAAVVAFQVLEHVPDPHGFLRACVACLKPGGRLIIAVPSAEGFLGNAVNSFLDLPPHHVSRWSEHTLRYAARLFRLECRSIWHEPIAPYHSVLARRVVIESAPRRARGLPSQLVDLSLTSRALSALSALAARLVPTAPARIKGHTVMACYEK